MQSQNIFFGPLLCQVKWSRTRTHMSQCNPPNRLILTEHTTILVKHSYLPLWRSWNHTLKAETPKGLMGLVMCLLHIFLKCTAEPCLGCRRLNIYHSNTRRQAQKGEVIFFKENIGAAVCFLKALQLTFKFLWAEQELLESLHYSCHQGNERARIVTAARAKLGALQASWAFVGLAWHRIWGMWM